MLWMVGRNKNALGLLGRSCIFKNRLEKPDKPQGPNPLPPDDTMSSQWWTHKNESIRVST